jgi:long-subunit fatty acid transport protein
MKFISRGFSLVTALLILSCFVHAGNYAGGFLSIGVGARALAMGGAFCAVADDASAIYWNPAGMTSIKGAEVSSIKLIDQAGIDSNYTYISAAYNSGENTGTFGVSFLNQAFNNVIITDSQGKQAGGATTVSDNTVYVAYAKRINAWLSAGVTAKVLFGSYPTGSISPGYNGLGEDAGVSIDMGAVSTALKGLKAAINIENIYTFMNWGSGGGFLGGVETVEPNLKSGISYTPFCDALKGMKSALTIAADYDTAYSGGYHFGAEYLWNDMIALRAGVQGYVSSPAQPAQDAGWSLGAGMKWYFIQVDYAYVKSDMAPLQYISISGIF